MRRHFPIFTRLCGFPLNFPPVALFVLWGSSSPLPPLSVNPIKVSDARSPPHTHTHRAEPHSKTFAHPWGPSPERRSSHPCLHTETGPGRWGYVCVYVCVCVWEWRRDWQRGSEADWEVKERHSGRKLGDGLEGGVRGSREVPGGDGETDGQTGGLGAVSGSVSWVNGGLQVPHVISRHTGALLRHKTSCKCHLNYFFCTFLLVCNPGNIFTPA